MHVHGAGTAVTIEIRQLRRLDDKQSTSCTTTLEEGERMDGGMRDTVYRI